MFPGYDERLKKEFKRFDTSIEIDIVPNHQRNEAVWVGAALMAQSERCLLVVKKSDKKPKF